MTPETLIIAGVIAFFGVFAVTLLSVSVWVALGPPDPVRKPAPAPVPARRPDLGGGAAPATRDASAPRADLA